MKRSRNILPALLLVMILLAACRSARPLPSNSAQSITNTPAVAGTPAGGNPLSATPGAQQPAPAAARPTSPAVESLAANLPAFDGIYWTDEVGVEPQGEEAVRLVSGLPCDNLLALLSSGEWRAVQQAAALPELRGIGATLALLELGERSALAALYDHDVVAMVPLGEPTPTPDPAFAANPVTGCSGTLQILPRQELQAEGDQQASGEALQYPMVKGCTFFNDSASVNLFYEGPDDLRATVDFTIPQAVGTYSVDEVDVSLQLMRSPLRYVEVFGEVYANAAAGGDDSGDWGSEYFPESEDSGEITVTSVNPLAGEINLSGFVSEAGELQSFRAGFACPPGEE